MSTALCCSGRRIPKRHGSYPTPFAPCQLSASAYGYSWWVWPQPRSMFSEGVCPGLIRSLQVSPSMRHLYDSHPAL